MLRKVNALFASWMNNQDYCKRYSKVNVVFHRRMSTEFK